MKTSTPVIGIANNGFKQLQLNYNLPSAAVFSLTGLMMGFTVKSRGLRAVY